MQLSFRSVGPSFWSDSGLAPLSDSAKLFYIGLWQIADDHGWFRLDIPEIAAVLYPYRRREAREESVSRHMREIQRLAGAPRVVVHQCGHSNLTRINQHQLHKGPPRRQYESEHVRCSALSGIAEDKPDNDALAQVRGGVVNIIARERAKGANGAEPGLKARLGDFTDIVKSVPGTKSLPFEEETGKIKTGR